MGAWDWNIVPGTTTLLNHPKLSGATADQKGNNSWVGVVSDGWVGTAVEDYIDPLEGSVAYKKMWFYMDDCVIVTTTNVTVSSTASTDQVVTVLDNRKAADGGIWIDGQQVSAESSPLTQNGSTLYYGGNGYLALDEPFNLTLFEGNRTGNWSAISTSIAGNMTVPIFSAYATMPQSTFSYALYPATDPDTLAYAAAASEYTVIDDGGVIGVAGQQRLSLIFWPGASTSVTINMTSMAPTMQGSMTVTSEQPAAYLFATSDNNDGTRALVVTASDPSQQLTSLTFSITADGMDLSCADEGYDTGCQAVDGGVEFDAALPQGGLAGSSMFRNIIDWKLITSIYSRWAKKGA